MNDIKIALFELLYGKYNGIAPRPLLTNCIIVELKESSNYIRFLDNNVTLLLVEIVNNVFHAVIIVYVYFDGYITDNPVVFDLNSPDCLSEICDLIDELFKGY